MVTAGHLCDGVPDTLPMLDDLLLASDTGHSWLTKLEQVLQNCQSMREPGFLPVKIREDKMFVLTDSVQFLSHSIQDGFLTADEEILKKIQQWAELRTLKQLQSFVGSLNYLRDFIPNASSLLGCSEILNFQQNDLLIRIYLFLGS